MLNKKKVVFLQFGTNGRPDSTPLIVAEPALCSQPRNMTASSALDRLPFVSYEE